MKEQDRTELVPTVSAMIMAAIAGGCIFAFLIVSSVRTFDVALQNWLGTLAVIATLAIACNQVIHSISELKCASGMDGLGKALTKIAAPFAVVVLAIVVSGQPSWWMVFGLVPFTASGWAKLADHLAKPHDSPNEPLA